jgi:hypothetical protein
VKQFWLTRRRTTVLFAPKIGLRVVVVVRDMRQFSAIQDTKTKDEVDDDGLRWKQVV